MKQCWVLAVAVLAACGTSGSPGDDDDNAPDASVTPGADADPNAPDADPNAPDADPNAPDAMPPVEHPRGVQWVRDNPMFISGLTVQMPAPSSTQLDEYFDDFGATAVHLWELGLPARMDGWEAAAAGRSDYRWLSWTHSDGTSLVNGDVIGGYAAGKPGRIGYQIGDEPRNIEDMTAMVAGVAAVRAADPDSLIVLNYSFSADDLDTLIDMFGDTDGDVLSFDTYSWSNGVYGRLNIFREAGLEQDRPYWCYLNSYYSDAYPTASDMRWNVFSHATFGYTGYSWFIYQIEEGHGLPPALFTAANSYAVPKTARFDLAAQLNRELANLGRVLTQLTSTDIRYLPFNDLLLPDGIEKWAPGAGGDSYVTAIEPTDSGWHEILVGFFRDDYGERYVMVQNVNHESGAFPNDNADPMEIRISFDFTGAGFDTTQVETFNKVTGVVEDVALSGSTLTVTLPAGDPILFKYKTGKPFAIQ